MRKLTSKEWGETPKHSKNRIPRNATRCPCFHSENWVPVMQTGSPVEPEGVFEKTMKKNPFKQTKKIIKFESGIHNDLPK